MNFRRETTADGIILEDGVESVQFEVPGRHRPTVGIRTIETDQKGFRDRVQFRAETEFEPAKAIIDAFASLEAGKLPDDTPPRSEWPRDFDYIHEDGTIHDGHSIPEPILSKSLQQFLDTVRDELTAATQAVFGVIRWRSALAGPHDPSLGGTTTWWAEGAKQWLPFPSSTSVRLSIHRTALLRPDIQADVQQMLDGEYREPLAHLLLREARTQQTANPRSAILIGLSALETAIKQFVSARVPEATWLVAESPSPSIARMLTEYLPKLTDPDGASFRSPDGELLETLKKGVWLRNKVAHIGYSDFREDTVENVLDAVENMLWRLDGAAGFSWAEMWESVDEDDL